MPFEHTLFGVILGMTAKLRGRREKFNHKMTGKNARRGDVKEGRE
jgi:hypothetical protein